MTFFCLVYNPPLIYYIYNEKYKKIEKAKQEKNPSYNRLWKFSESLGEGNNVMEKCFGKMNLGSVEDGLAHERPKARSPARKLIKVTGNMERKDQF